MARIVDDRDLEEAVPRHVQLANAVVADGMKMVDGTPCVPDGGGAYRFGWDAVNRALFMADQCSSMRTRKEACATLRFLAPEAPAAHWRYIAFSNGVLDVRTGELASAAEFAAGGLGIVPAAIPHEWDPEAAPDEAVETLLEGVSCGDALVRANLEEVWGLCMSRLADDRARAAWLYGEGQNGKSTYIDATLWMLGERNAAALMLEDFGGFSLHMAVGKLAVIADDQPPTSVPKVAIGVIKKMVTGQGVKVEQKGKDPYNARLFCTVIATSNEPPTFGDTSHGSMRRWHPVPFNARFGDAGSGRDVELSERLRTEGAARWMARLGVEGLRRVVANEGMTETEYSRDAIEEARRDSNSVLAFIAEHERGEFLADPNVEVWYWRYCDYMRDSGGRAFDQRQFSRFVCTRLGLRTANDGRYRMGDPQLCLGELARSHGRRPGDKYRVFRDKGK